MNETGTAPRSEAGEAVFVFSTLGTKRGGVTRMILTRMRLFAEAGIPVRLLLSDHSPHEDAEEAAIRRSWGLPDSVEIRYFWREAAPGGGGTEPDPLAAAAEEPGLTSFAEPSGSGRIVRFYDNGVLAKSKHFDGHRRVVRIDHHDIARRVVTREYFDPDGRLVRADDVNPETGARALRRWFDRSGACWLTSWISEDGKTTRSVRHRPEPAAYDSYYECVAEWVDAVLADSPAPVVFSDRRPFDRLLLALRHPRARTVAALHNCHTTQPYRSTDPTNPTWRPLVDNFGAFDTVVVLTERQRRDLTARCGGGNATVINHAASPAPETRATRQPGVLVTVARMEPQKRLSHAIHAFAIVASKVPDARFDIYGSGSNEAKLKALVDKLDLADRVRFRGFTDRPLEAFACASAAVLSSWYEGWGLVLTEAMSVGTPVVAYDINYGPAEVVRDEVDGLLVPPGDIDALAAAMVRVLGDDDFARSLGERATEVTERFSVERWQREWLELFHTLASTPVESARRGHGADRSTRRAAGTS
ncbi:glycosyltransferase [Haloechinothrix alba]|uniref:glycosyltransferase n=1 Tax=Haloechinothrix alba TaxID=664784 RepID=UPI00159588E4|nr:glycosyltransferase [Haloechinothrix alba]